ncbi:MAG: hypothetical protein JWP00_2600 [Chloroflexi bacterium]|nr:hypothetical protein [Chloroflexota bacterium]
MSQRVKKEKLNKSSLEEPETATPADFTGDEDDSTEGNPVVFSAGKRRNAWQLFTSHGLVLISILNNPGRTIREIGLELNLTDRAVALAIADLVEDGYLVRERIGRRTFYHVNEDHPLRYPVSPYGLEEKPHLTVQALRAENLATHASKPAKRPE